MEEWAESKRGRELVEEAEVEEDGAMMNMMMEATMEEVEIAGVEMVETVGVEVVTVEVMMEEVDGVAETVEEEVVMEEVEVTEDLRHNIINMYRYVDEHKWTRI